MTVNTAIAQADILRPNSCQDTVKEAWLRELDAQFADMLAADAEDTAPGEDGWPFVSPWPGSDPELLIPAPEDGVYVLYLAARLDLYHQEYDAYANSRAAFNEAAAELRAAHRRAHRAKDGGNWRVM